MDFKNTKVGKFGEVIGLGWTVGEEILYGDDDAKRRPLSPKGVA